MSRCISRFILCTNSKENTQSKNVAMHHLIFTYRGERHCYMIPGQLFYLSFNPRVYTDLINTTGTTCWNGSIHLSKYLLSPWCLFWVRVALSFGFFIAFCVLLFVFWFFLLCQRIVCLFLTHEFNMCKCPVGIFSFSFSLYRFKLLIINT